MSETNEEVPQSFNSSKKIKKKEKTKETFDKQGKMVGLQ